MTVKALQVHAGPRALKRLREQGLQAQDVRAIPAAAGGPKGLVLNPLDQFIFGDWLAAAARPVHLIGASIGAWRMATACLPQPAQAFARMADDYIRQEYEHKSGKPPTPTHVSQVFNARLTEHFVGHEDEVLNHPRFRLHVFTSRGRHLLRREGRRLSRVTTPLGYLGAFAANVISRKAMGAWLERVIFSDPREPLPLRTHDYRTHMVSLNAGNLQASILASCSIPFLLDAVHDIPDAPHGVYWDGGITDYHLHLNYASMDDGLVLYPHFQKTVIPGWLDKALKHRHRASAHLDNVVVVSPNAEWIKTLPNAKLPDRHDFKHYGPDGAGRMAAWARAVSESQRLRDEFEALVRSDRPIEAQAL
ncbi:MAG: phospholipase [Cytophagales bacterium]|nr:phospholipase [Rhizobacter sp.]